METKSLFWKKDTIIQSKDENGNPAEGTRLFITPSGEEFYLRFRNGFLDGDSYTKDGKLVVQPAVEGAGHIEYWREGKLHRDGGLEAVYAEGFSVKEYWINNERIEL